MLDANGRVKKYYIAPKARNKYTGETRTMNLLINWKTTLTAVVGAITYLVAVFGIQVPVEVQTGLVAVILFFIGLFAKDSGTGDQAK